MAEPLVVDFKTKDGVKIEGDFYRSVAASNKSVLLLHILPGKRQDWNEFIPDLVEAGFNVLNIDERGHGASEAWPGEEGSWQEFGQADFDKMIYDVEAGADFLREKNSGAELAVIGASIGANLAMIYGAKAQPKVVVTLSPGVEYRGIKSEIASRNFRQSLLVVASRDDKYAFESSEKLFDISSAKKKDFVKYEDAGHGTRMFASEPELKERIIEFLKNEL